MSGVTCLVVGYAASVGGGRALAPLRQCGLLHADARNNAVFLATRQHRKPTGAECYGTVSLPNRQRFRGMAPGSRRNCVSFWIHSDHTPLHTILIAESTIDALSTFSLADL